MERESGWAFIDLAWEGRGYCSVYTMSFIGVRWANQPHGYRILSNLKQR